MNLKIKKRVLKEAQELIKSKKTIREIAALFKISKSTVHKDFNERLKKIDIILYRNVKDVLNEHIKIRHIRGGNSTKEKYKKRLI